MIISFKHKGLKNFFLRGDSSKIHGSHVGKLRLILAKLHAAKTIRDIDFPGSNLHPLKGNLAEHWSLSVSGNWRITFKFINEEVHIVDYIDYH